LWSVLTGVLSLSKIFVLVRYHDQTVLPYINKSSRSPMGRLSSELTAPQLCWAVQRESAKDPVQGRQVLYRYTFYSNNIVGDLTLFVGQTKASGPNKGKKLSCDEYPFASSEQSSANAWVGCIVAYQNTAQGAVYLGPFYRRNKMVKGSPFMMELDGIDCSTVSYNAIPKCNNNKQPIPIDTSNGVFYPADVGSPDGSLLIEIGDLPGGT
jgi:hypothetical protein